MAKENIIKDKSFAFALRIVSLYKYLTEEKKEYALSKQIVRSGTAIAALIREAEHAESKADFIHKISIALKEANETDLWVDLIRHGNYISEKEYLSLKPEVEELNKILVAIKKSSKAKASSF